MRAQYREARRAAKHAQMRVAGVPDIGRASVEYRDPVSLVVVAGDAVGDGDGDEAMEWRCSDDVLLEVGWSNLLCSAAAGPNINRGANTKPPTSSRMKLIGFQ